MRDTVASLIEFTCNEMSMCDHFGLLSFWISLNECSEMHWEVACPAVTVVLVDDAQGRLPPSAFHCIH